MSISSGNLLKSSQAARHAASRVNELAVDLSSTSATALQASSMIPLYVRGAQNLKAIWSDFRRALSVCSWSRYVDVYDWGNALTIGHEVQFRMTELEFSRVIDGTITQALPPDMSPVGQCSVKFLQPNVMGQSENDAISITLPLVLKGAASNIKFTVKLVGYVDFSELHYGKFILLNAPSVLSDIPVDVLKIARDIEERVHKIRIIDRQIYSQLGDLIPFSSEINQNLTIFTRLPIPDRNMSELGLTVPSNVAMPSNFTVAVVIPRTTYAPRSKSNTTWILDRGNVPNPYGVGADKVLWFATKSRSGPIQINVELGSFGRYRHTVPLSEIYFHLCFETVVVGSNAQLVAVLRFASDGSVASRQVIRQIPGASAATVKMTDQSDVEFWIEKRAL